MPDYPLVSRNTYGKGSATYIATQFFSKYVKKPSPALRQVLLDMLLGCGIDPYAIFEKEDMKPQSALITSLIANDQNTVKIITVTNTDYDRVEDSILLPLGEYELVDRIEGYTVTVKNEKIRISFSLGSLETMSIYRTK